MSDCDSEVEFEQHLKRFSFAPERNVGQCDKSALNRSYDAGSLGKSNEIPGMVTTA